MSFAVASEPSLLPFASSPPLSVHHLLERQAKQHPDVIAIAAPDRPPLTYGRLYQQVVEVVTTLNARGVGRNDRVGLVLPNGPEMAVAFLAVAAGATCVPLNPGYRASEFDFYLSDVQAKALLVQAGIDSPARAVSQARDILLLELSPAFEAEAGLFTLTGETRGHPPLCGFAQPEDGALVLYTSGTTARPKIVPLTHTNICTSAYNHTTILDLGTGDRCLNVMPLFHIHGLISVVLSSVLAGASVVYPPGFDPSQFFSWLAAFAPTWYTAAPSLHQAILAEAASHHGIIAPCPLRFIRSAAAPLPPPVLAALERAFNVPVIEAYGMTEAAAQITSNPLPPRERKVGSVGIAVGVDIGIIDGEGNLLPPGESGEIVIRGPSLMQGYENNPEANAHAFTQGWFRTGDQGYIDTDGYLFITGRLKELINRGGEKIAPREVEEVLLKHPAVAQAVTFALPHPGLGEDVAAAVVLRENTTVTERDIQLFATTHLADFKIPRQIFFLEELPKGPTGKLERIGLAKKLGLLSSGTPRVAEETAYRAPQTLIEEILAELWGQVLGLARVSIYDHFFQLGGDSILATQLIARVRDTMHVALSFHTFFAAPTVASMAQNIETMRERALAMSAPALQSIARNTVLPLSFAQQRLWFFDQWEPESSVYNILLAFRLYGPLDVAALEQSFSALVRRHESLRTTFATVDGQPTQVIQTVQTCSLAVIDLQQLPEAEREAQAMQLATREAQQPFDLAEGPLFRLTLLRLGVEDHVLLCTMHHIIADEWSKGVFLRELTLLYGAFSAGKPSPLAELPIQYADFALWQRQWLQGKILEQQLAYWKHQLTDTPPILELPTDRPRPPVQTFRGASHSLMLPLSLSQSLKALSRQEKVTLFMLLLAAFQTLLYRYTGQDDIVVGSPIAGRTQKETEGLIGFFVNTLALRTHLSGNPPFRELLGRVRAVCVGAYAHQDLPFEKLVEELQPARNLSYSPLFQVMFALQNVPKQPLELPGIAVSLLAVDPGTAKFDLTLSMVQEGEELRGTVEYNTDLFDKTTITRLIGHFQTLLEGIVANPDQSIATLPLLTEAERQKFLLEWNRTQIEYPKNSGIQKLFEAQVERTPDALAVICGEERLSYQELNRRANQLAHHLQAFGVGPEVFVGIFVERSLAMVVGLMGILKAGGAYVPLDPMYPRERLAYMLADARTPILLTQQRLVERLPDHRAQVLCLDTDWEHISRESEENPVSTATADNAAYVIYTSGSTGRPKGVLITQRNVVHSTCARIAYYHEPVISFLLLSSFAFDSSVAGIFWTLCQGGTLVLPHGEGERDLEQLAMVIPQYRISHLLSIPSLYGLLLIQAKPTQLLSLHTAIVAGESCPKGLIERHRQLLPEVSLHNEYGPTEGTVWSSVYDCQSNALREVVPIGQPIANMQMYLLDAHWQPVPIGIPGELYIGGDGLARGYLTHPELTAERFLPNPFSNHPGARLYKTGDLARYLPDGNIEFLGRLDHQVKVRGFRIEVGEIEMVLGQHPGVQETVVVARTDGSGDRYLVAYIVPTPEWKPTSSELRHFLKEKLPDYLIPSIFVILQALPLTPNGKVDRQALPAPDQFPPEREESIVAPRTTIEEVLVDIWAQVLKRNQISIHDNFFDLGGHSLLATQLITRVRQAFQIEVPLRSLFETPTVAGLAMTIAQRQTAQMAQEDMGRLLTEVEELSENEAQQLLHHERAGEIIPAAPLPECNQKANAPENFHTNPEQNVGT
jgi:amino acid adenylation domain-containing protein